VPPDLIQALLDPTAPLPAGWPSGAWGAFLLFLVPVGGGIPTGVLMARAAGISPPVMAVLYLFSDVIQAFIAEPLLVTMRWLAQWVPFLGRVRDWLASLTGHAGLRHGGAQGPLGLILVSFTVDPMTGRAAAAAAGHGFAPGWTLAIAGDMIYFALLMASTLWLSAVLGDERITIGAMLLVMWGVPLLVRRWLSPRQGRAAIAGRPAAGRTARRRPARARD